MSGLVLRLDYVININVFKYITISFIYKNIVRN